MSEDASKHAVPSYMEFGDVGKSGAPSFEALAQHNSFKGKQTAQSASVIGEKNPQDRSVYKEPPADDLSSSSSMDYDGDVDEIDPDDSVSATSKQPTDHRTTGSTESRTYMEDADDDGNPIDDTRTYVSVVPPGVKEAANVSRTRNRTLVRGSSPSPNPTDVDSDSESTAPHQQQEPESVSSSVYIDSGPVRPPVSPYPCDDFPPPAPQDVTPSARTPAPYYANAGHIPPNHDRPAKPYWQRESDGEGKEMVPYQMRSPSGPAQGDGSPPSAPIGRMAHRGLEMSRKGKEGDLSLYSFGAESRPDGPAADEGRPNKGSGKSGGDAVVLRLPADVDTVYNSADARDLTVHLELDLFRDIDDELEEFNRLMRMGNFVAADSFFESYLKEHMSSDPFVFVQYAEMLLEKGDFKSLLLLDGDSVFAKQGFPGCKDSEKSEAKGLLEMNWMLVRAMALFHSQHSLHKLRVFSLGMRLACLAPDRTIPRSLRERAITDWADWKNIYRELLAEQRIWDFRDLLIQACISYDTERALNAFLDHASPIDGMVADWQTSTPDESTQLALLDLLSFIALNSDQSMDDGGLAQDCLRLAEPIGNALLDKFPHTVHSRPFIQWLVSKAVVENRPEQFAYLSDYAGLAICPKSAGALPYYIPIRQENPGWVPQGITPSARDVLEAALKAARDMQDYQTETLCLNQLALGTKDPAAYFQQLGQLQKRQRNMAGFLSTCLTSYLICQDNESKNALQEDLDSFGTWKDVSDLINPTEAAARDVVQHALSRGPAKSSCPSIMLASRYSSQLPETFKSIIPHLPRLRFADNGEEPIPLRKASRGEPKSERKDEPKESHKNSTGTRNTHIGGSRGEKKAQAKESHQTPPAAYYPGAGYYPGPWTNYGMPPYYPMNMMYGSHPPPQTGALQLPPPPPSTVEEDSSKTQLDMMKELLDLLLAERKEAKEQANMEAKIRENAEHAFEIRIEKMQQAREEAKKEIELARIEAEKAARAHMEEERKLEAERQTEHAEMMAKAERIARDHLEKERKEEAERARQHAEAMAKAEREAQKNYVAERALMEAELRIQLAGELKAQEEARAAAEARAAEEKARREVEDAVLRAQAVRAYEDKIAAEWEAGEERRRWEAEVRAQGAREERERVDAERRVEEEERVRRHSIS